MAQNQVQPAPNRTEGDDIGQWRNMLDKHGAEHGFHIPLGDSHGVLYTADERTLIVSFENAEHMRSSETGLPLGLQVAGREGWSNLALYSEGKTWFRDPAVYNLFDTLTDEQFFDDFDRVLFCGAGPGGYAAAAFSVACPGAQLLLMRPQATLDPRVTEWDRRFPKMRRKDWTSRYGFGPEQAEAADHATIVYDPRIREDAMHAAMFTREGFTKLRAPFLGERLERDLDAMGILLPMIRLAGKGQLSPERFAKLYRRRRGHPAWLLRVLSHLETLNHPMRKGKYARAVLSEHRGRRFRRALQAAEAQLQEEGKSLPAALPPKDEA